MSDLRVESGAAVRRQLILASASPRRSELLASVGAQFSVIASDVDESIDSRFSPTENAKSLARKKAHAISVRHPKAVVLAADTIVVSPDNGEVLGKPSDIKDAKHLLGLLLGKKHQVITAYCLRCEELLREELEAVSSMVQIRQLSEDDLQCYIATGDPMDKAGAYGIQGVGAFLVEAVHGSYTNVVGLPLAEVVSALRRFSVWSPEMLPKVGTQRQ